MMRTTVSLCERCWHYDWQKVQELQAVWRDCGWPPFEHIWCAASDQPEELRWEKCPTFSEIGG